MSEVVAVSQSSGPTSRPELFFGLVGPIGCNIHAVEVALADALKSVDYHPEIISLSNKIADLIALKKGSRPELKTLEEKINAGNEVRELFSADGIVAVGALQEIQAARLRAHKKFCHNVNEEDVPICEGAAYIIRQFKRGEEISFLEKLYGRQFIQVSITQDEASRFSELRNRIRHDSPEYDERTVEGKARELMQRDINEGAVKRGQRVEDIFHLGDVFIDASTPDLIEKTTRRFVYALFGRTNIAPSRAEHGSYIAKAASLRSIDLSRQVGAAIVSAEGDIVSVGCNEVPKPLGGNYWDDDEKKSRDIDRTGEANKDETKRIMFDFLRMLHQRGALNLEPDEILSSEDWRNPIKESMISEITEYGRMVHAEMNAICDAARLGRSVRGATMYVTTFPCHNCAKHIIASGIKAIVYVEPYPKSRTLMLYEDAVTVEADNQSMVEVKHFAGISPRRYRDIFEKGKRRDGDGNVKQWIAAKPKPQVPTQVVDYREAEDAAISTNLAGLA